MLKIRSNNLIRTLFFILLNCAAGKLFSQSSPFGFIQNQGQITDQYGGKNENVEFLTSDFKSNVNLILETIDISETVQEETIQENITETKKDIKISAYHILTDIDTEREERLKQRDGDKKEI